MLRPHGYVTITSPEAFIERDSISCGHCGRVVFVKPNTRSTVYLFPQLFGPDKEEPGAACMGCAHKGIATPICLQCHADGRCIPMMKRIELMEDKRMRWDEILAR